MDTRRLGMRFTEFFVERSWLHTCLWIVVGFMLLWAMLFFGAGTLHGWPILSAIAALAITVISCLLMIPLLIIQPLALLTIYLEARWRVRHNRPYVAPPPEPYRPPPEPPRVVVVGKKRGGWLIPLAIGLWIGSSWGGED